MSISVAANLNSIARADDPKTEILKAVGDLSKLEVLGDRVLVATYVRPEKTAGGLFLPDSQRSEDRYQGKVGLILKKGPTAFKYDGAYPYEGSIPEDGKWVVYRTSDAWEFFYTLKGGKSEAISLRLIPSDLIRAVVDDPAAIY